MSHQNQPRKLSDQELAVLKAEFDKMDKNKDGSVSRAELEESLKDGSHSWYHDNKEETNYMFDLMDQDGNGTVDFQEFLAIMAASEDEMMKQLFRLMDKDSSGKLSATELKEFLKVLGFGKMSDKDIETFIKEADKNGDGEIDYDEVVAHFYGEEDDQG